MLMAFLTCLPCKVPSQGRSSYIEALAAPLPSLEETEPEVSRAASAPHGNKVPALLTGGHSASPGLQAPINSPPSQVTKRGHHFPAGHGADRTRQMAPRTQPHPRPSCRLLAARLPPSGKVNKYISCWLLLFLMEGWG